MTRICRSDLIVDIGMLPAEQDAAGAFYRITSLPGNGHLAHGREHTHDSYLVAMT